MCRKTKLYWISILAGSCVCLLLIVLYAFCKNPTNDEKTKLKAEKRETLQETEVCIPKTRKEYDLPVDENERKMSQDEGTFLMEKVRKVYTKYKNGTSSNVVLSRKGVDTMVACIGDTGIPVLYNNGYAKMRNYQKVEFFLKKAQKGIKGQVVLYEVYVDGGLGRKKIRFDGKNMYILDARFTWKNQDEVSMDAIVYTKVKKWKYTKKGWFMYEYCTPEVPQVSEVVDRNQMMRIRPISPKYQDILEKYLLILGYKGNNLMCSDWNEASMDAIDYNGAFEYFYEMEYGKKMDETKYEKGIPKQEVENVIKKYLPVSAEKIRRYAALDKKSQKYVWRRMSCMNYNPNAFGLSIPEVTKIRNNGDGTMVLSIDVVNERLGNDCIMQHEMVVRWEKNKLKFLSNRILGEAKKYIPKYQYRIKKAT